MTWLEWLDEHAGSVQALAALGSFVTTTVLAVLAVHYSRITAKVSRRQWRTAHMQDRMDLIDLAMTLIGQVEALRIHVHEHTAHDAGKLPTVDADVCTKLATLAARVGTKELEAVGPALAGLPWLMADGRDFLAAGTSGCVERWNQRVDSVVRRLNCFVRIASRTERI